MPAVRFAHFAILFYNPPAVPQTVIRIGTAWANERSPKEKHDMAKARIWILALTAIAGIAVCAAVVFLLARSVTRGGATPTAEPLVDEVWNRITATGKLVVGTSADYPPFEYLTPESEIDGFDIALVERIGQRLGLEIEVRNMAFDGLTDALYLGQIDAAIAAISVTPEREALVDFSNVYLVGEDGILAGEDGGIEHIGSAADLADHRVGVQRGTVYQDWLQSSLLDTGDMPADNLFVYENAEDAVRDLRQGRLDLVMLDLLPAQAFAAQGESRIVGQGLNQQRLALALPKGASAMKAEIDRALAELHNEGMIGELARTYLDLEQLLPIPPPAPTSTALSGGGCVAGLGLVRHLTYDDQAMNAPPEMLPGQAFSKGWQVRNTGTCPWDSGYRLVYAGGSHPAAGMGGQPLAVRGQVAPGATADLTVDLVAPLRPGTYQGFWLLETATGKPVGERLPVGIRVLAVPTATPAPTQTPSPGITFTVDRSQIRTGECVVFFWQVDNAKAAYFYAEHERWQDRPVPTESRQQECPPHRTTYSLRVVRPDNSVEVRQTTVYVEPSSDAPQISRFSVDPPGQVPMGQCVTLRWGVEGEAIEIHVTSNDTVLWRDAPLQGNLKDCPAGPASVTYGVEAVGTVARSRASETIQVVDAPTATPVAPGSPDLPQIHSFSVSPGQIMAGECVGVSWSVGGTASMIEIHRDGTLLLSDTSLAGREVDCPDTAGTYTYRLDAYNLGGQSDFREQTVYISEAALEDPLAGTSWAAAACYDGATLAPVLERTLLTAGFGSDGSLNGSAGCNTYAAHYLLQGATLQITQVQSTTLSCAEPAGLMEQEVSFLTALSSAATYRLEGDQLYIQDGSGQTLVELVRIDD